MRNLTAQLTETSDDKCRIEERLANLQRSLVEVEEDKRGLDGRFASAQTALVMQEETIRRESVLHLVCVLCSCGVRCVSVVSLVCCYSVM